MVVVVVVVGVVRRHLLDAGGDAPHRLHFRLRGCSALCPPSPRPALPPGLPCPVPPVPWGPCACPCPCPWAPFRSRARVAGPASRPPHPGPLALPSPLVQPPAPGCPSRAPDHPSRALAPPRPPARVAGPASRPPRPGPLALPPPLAPSPAPGPPARAPARPSRAPTPPLPPACHAVRRSPSPPPLRPSWTTRRASRCLCSCGSVTPGGERSRVGGRTCRSRPGGKGLGGYGLGGAGVGVGGVGVGAVLRALPGPLLLLLRRPPARRPRPVRGSSPACAACQGPQPLSRPPHSPSLPWRPPTRRPWPRSQTLAHPPRSSLLPRRPPARRPRPVRGPSQPLWAPCLLSCAAAAALGDASGSCAGAAPLAGGVPGAAAGAAAWLAAVSASCASGRGGAAGLAAWAAGAAVLGWPRFPGRRRRSDHRRLRQPPLLALREGLPRPLWGGDGGAGAGPAVVAVVPPEGPIAVTLVGMRGGRRALPTTSWCISAVPWAVPCGALRGGGGEGVGGRLWRQSPHGRGSAAIHRHWEGRRGEPRGPRVAPQLPVWGGAQGPGPPGGRRAVPGAAAPDGPP